MNLVFLLRHFPTEDNERGLIMGQSDRSKVIPREITGLSALKDLQHRLRIFSSTSGRCANTCGELTRQLGLDPSLVFFTPLLLERNMGAWEGLEKSAVHAQFSSVFSKGSMNPFFCPPAGESFRRFFCRISSAIDFVAEDCNNLAIPVIVSHNQTLKLLTHLLRQDYVLSNWFSLAFEHAQLFRLEIPDWHTC